MTAESAGTRLVKQAFEGLTGRIKLPKTPSLYYNPPSHFEVSVVEFEKGIPGIGKGGRIPDILLTDTDGRKLAVELCNTNPKTEDWIQDIASIGLLAIEVDVLNLKPNFGVTYVERANEIFQGAKWLNPGPPAALTWLPYTNILSYYQSCETGFILERDGEEILVQVLFDRGQWHGVVGRGKIGHSERIGQAREDILAAVQDAWANVHLDLPPSSVPLCPTTYFTGLDISDPRLRGFWDKYDKCAECLGVIPDFEMVLGTGTHTNGQKIKAITPSMFSFSQDPWAGRPPRLYLESQPDKLYCWLCAALHQKSVSWKFLPPKRKSDLEGDPPEFWAFRHWKLAKAEEQRRAGYLDMEPGRWPDDFDVSDRLGDIEKSIAQGNLEGSLKSLRALKAYQPEGRARAVQAAQQIAQGWFRELPFPLQQAIRSKSVDPE